MNTFGTILTCGIHGDRCPFNWNLLVEGADVENTKYTLNFNPDMWIPANVKTID